MLINTASINPHSFKIRVKMQLCYVRVCRDARLTISAIAGARSFVPRNKYLQSWASIIEAGTPDKLARDDSFEKNR